MKLHSMGIGYSHDGNFKIFRPTGSGDNLLLVFLTPAFVQTAGEYYTVPAGTAVLYAKDSPQIYGATGVKYINHWVHFECDENDIFFDMEKTLFNTPVPVAELNTVENLLELMSSESVSANATKDITISLLLQLLIVKCVSGGFDKNKTPHSEVLRDLRAYIYKNPSEKYNIDMLASRLSLSSSYFQSLYKEEFGVSCYEDVLRAKTQLAEYYLKNTVLPISRIAELCGYENDVHFMRQFRTRTGYTAAKYRKLNNE